MITRRTVCQRIERGWRAIPFVAALFASLAAFACESATPAAELVFTGGRIHTVDAALPEAQAFAVRDGRFVFVGSNAGAQAWIGADTRVIPLDGRLVLPGFIDAHVHPLSGYGLQLDGVTTVKDVFDRIGAYAASHPDEAWIEGYGWDLTVFPARGPRRESLDSLVPDRPALIWGGDGHSAWANSRALAAAGITRTTPNPDGGRIERNADGSPSGTLREAAATMAERVVPPWSLDKRLAALDRSLASMARFGITGFLDASIDDDAMLEVYREAARRGMLAAHARVSIAIPRESEALDLAATVERARTLRESVAPFDDLDANTVKIFVDGVIEAGTAAMLEPYAGTDGDRGEMLRSPATLDSLARRFHEAGFQLHFHAIGDRAIRSVLDAIDGAGIRADSSGPGPGRPLIAHAQLVDPADVPRFARLGATPVFSALWAYADSYIRDLTIPRLGPERSRWIYPIGTLLAAGSPIAMGSDWPVTSMDPLRAIEVAVTRIDPAFPSDSGVAFLPGERINVESAIAAYTLGSARATLMDSVTGSITSGKRADFIVLSDDLFAIEPGRIADVRVLLTMFSGREVYRDPDWREQ